MDEDKLESGDSIENAEEEKGEEKTSEEEKNKETKKESDEEEGGEDKKTSSILAQKKHWREKAQIYKKELEDLKTQLSEKIQAKENISEDDAEKKAQAYIDSRIEKILASREKSKEMEETKNLAKFEEEIDEVLEENIEFTEKQILDLCEEMEVTPKVAAKILKKQQESSKKKPLMPSPKQASSETKIKEEERKPSGNFWDVTDKILKKIRNKEI